MEFARLTVVAHKLPVSRASCCEMPPDDVRRHFGESLRCHLGVLLSDFPRAIGL
jgi:hypothetical protein